MVEVRTGCSSDSAGRGIHLIIVPSSKYAGDLLTTWQPLFAFNVARQQYTLY